jgi:U3 small nucleolar RNA-associated protein 19
MVPAYTAAAFAKRMARLALSAPPAGAMLALAFVHNIVRRHPACMCLLHKPPSAAAAAGSGGGGGAEGNGAAAAAAASASDAVGVDVYDASEPDPAKSRAVESSLWEVAALRNHYSPQVCVCGEC